MDVFVPGWRLFLASAALATGAPAVSQPVPPPATPPAAAQPAANAAPEPPQTQPLPAIPAAPQATLPAYPACRNDHVSTPGRRPKAIKVNSCIELLDNYNNAILQVFARRMAAYVDALGALWAEVDRGPYSYQQKREFYARINTEFTNAQEDGSYMDQYRATHGRFLADRAYLQTEFCNLVRCVARQ